MENYIICEKCGEKVYFVEITKLDLETGDCIKERVLKSHKCMPKKACINCVFYEWERCFNPKTRKLLIDAVKDKGFNITLSEENLIWAISPKTPTFLCNYYEKRK